MYVVETRVGSCAASCASRSTAKLEAAGAGQGELMALHYRDEEVIYVQASSDRVTVIFSTMFREETDRVFGKVFLQVSRPPPSSPDPPHPLPRAAPA